MPSFFTTTTAYHDDPDSEVVPSIRSANHVEEIRIALVVFFTENTIRGFWFPLLCRPECHSASCHCYFNGLRHFRSALAPFGGSAPSQALFWKNREDDLNPLLTPDQVAEILGISPRTVNVLCKRKKLRFIQVDAKHRRFTQEMVEEFIENQTVHPLARAAQRSLISKSQHLAAQTVPAIRRPCLESADELKAEMDAF